MLDISTKRRIDTARDILVGKVPDPKAQVEQITTALIYKFMDDMDKESEELGGSASFFVNGYSKYAWSTLLNPRMGGQERLNLYAEALTKLHQNEHLPQLFRDIFKDAFLPYRDPETLNLFLKEINGFTYDHSERLGDSFEYLLSVLGSQGDAGQFRTPRHIIDFIVEVVDPKKDETILDPACGTAGFLISAYKHILKQNSVNRLGDQLTPEERTKLMTHFAGYDISPDMVRLSLVNMYLHGFPKPNIHEYDSLTSEERWDETYDVIMANPPFMSPKGGIRPHKRFSTQANRSEVLFVDYIAEHLSTTGRAGVIVPEGIIFQSGTAYKALRKMLVEKHLWAVVSLPSGVFQPYSGVKTSILLMDKTLAKKADSILFVRVENDGFDLGAQRRKIEKNDLTQALAILQRHKLALQNSDESIMSMRDDDGSTLAIIVEKAKIAHNGDYNLTGDRYRAVASLANQKWPMVRLEDISSLIQRGKSPVYGSSDVQIIKSGQARGYFDFDFTNKHFVANDFSLDHRQLQKGDLLINSTGVGTAGRVTFFGLNGSYLADGHITIVRLNKDLADPVFVLYVLANYYGFKGLESMARGNGGQIELSLSTIENLEIFLPPLKIQQAIVAEINDYQRIIDGAKQVVKSWKPVLKVDQKWERVKIGEVCLIERGASPRPIDEYITDDPAGLNWVKIGDTKDIDKYIFKTAEKITPEGALKSRKVNVGDFVLSNSMSFGRPYIMAIEGYIHDGWLRLSEDTSRVDKDFLYYIIGSDVVKQQFERAATGGVVRNLNSELVRNVEIPLPSMEMQRMIVEEIEAEQKRVQATKELIEIFEQKTKDKIAEVWGE